MIVWECGQRREVIIEDTFNVTIWMGAPAKHWNMTGEWLMDSLIIFLDLGSWYLSESVRWAIGYIFLQLRWEVGITFWELLTYKNLCCQKKKTNAMFLYVIWGLIFFFKWIANYATYQYENKAYSFAKPFSPLWSEMPPLSYMVFSCSLQVLFCSANQLVYPCANTQHFFYADFITF